MPRQWTELSGSAGSHGVTEDELSAVLAKAARHHRPESVWAELIFSEPAASATLGIWRFSSGQWSAVLKVLRHSSKGSGLWQSDEDVGHWYYWRREADAYSSGLFAAFAGGLRTPTCLGVFDRPDRSVGVWMEDLGDGVPAASWTLQQYRLAAEALGQAQGGSSTVAARATQPWLVRDWLRRFVERRGEFLKALASPGWDHPMVRQYLPPDTADRAADIWDSRETLLAMVEEMPAVLTHNDLHPGNLFGVGSSTVLIDWGFVSIGGMGEDPGNLVFDAVLDFFVAPETFPALDQAVTGGYLKGVAATVPGIDVGAVQRAIWATGALRYFWIPLSMVVAASEERPTLNRRAIDDAFPTWAKLVPYIFEFASRARSA